MKRVHLIPSALRPKVLRPPLSKSDALRALTLEHALGLQDSVVPEDSPALPEDIRVLREGLRILRESPHGGRVDCRDGGAPFRFLAAQAAVTPGVDLELTGSPRLAERPHGPLFSALDGALGSTSGWSDRWPLRLRAPSARAAQPEFVVDAQQSSQFASALFLAAVAASRREARTWRIRLTGPPTSAGYLDLTLQWMRAGGVKVQEVEERCWRVDATSTAPARLPPVPADWSSLGYLLLIAWKLDAEVHGANLNADHPDRAIVGHLREAGLDVVPSGAGALRVRGTASHGVVASAADTPDLIPTLAAFACVLARPSRFERIGVLRHKESDRIEAIRELVTAFGGTVELRDDTLIIHPVSRSVALPVELHARGDHRRALASATLSVLTGVDLLLHGADCVGKSFPAFFTELGAAPAD